MAQNTIIEFAGRPADAPLGFLPRVPGCSYWGEYRQSPQRAAQNRVNAAAPAIITGAGGWDEGYVDTLGTLKINTGILLPNTPWTGFVHCFASPSADAAALKPLLTTGVGASQREPAQNSTGLRMSFGTLGQLQVSAATRDNDGAASAIFNLANVANNTWKVLALVWTGSEFRLYDVTGNVQAPPHIPTKPLDMSNVPLHAFSDGLSNANYDGPARGQHCVFHPAALSLYDIKQVAAQMRALGGYFNLN